MIKCILKRVFLPFVFCFVIFSCKGKEAPLRLWYDKPASDWMTEALPIGNGYMGAMVFGTVPEEHIQFNEESLWSGGPGSHPEYNYGNRKGAYKSLGKIRLLLEQGKYKQAHRIANEELTGIIHRDGLPFMFGDYGCYQNFGDVFVKADHDTLVTHYFRELDIENAVAHVSYKADGVHFERTYFASYPDRIIIFRFSNDQSGGVDYRIKIHPAQQNANIRFQDNILYLTGNLPDNQMAYEARILLEGENLSTNWADSVLHVGQTNDFYLVLSAATGYRPQYPEYRGGDYTHLLDQTFAEIQNKTYKQLLNNHIKDYSNLYSKVTLNLEDALDDARPTDQRLKEYDPANPDHYLEQLFFQYGRYMLISSSRPGSLPANLQGKWNNSNDPPWACDYHTNINLQMNYWPAEVTNLSETHKPLFTYMKSLVEPGRVSAKEHFNANGWIVNTMNNPFGFTAPGWSFPWGLFPAGAAWLCQHLWEHYAFTQDKDFLRNLAYPLMKEAAAFWMDYLVEDEDGLLVSMPSYSPEHGGISTGATMDHQIVWDLFTNIIAASQALGEKDDFVSHVTEMRSKLFPLKIGKWGQLQEWKEDVDDPESKHRHVSHLFALHPGRQISIEETPDLAEAARVSLNARGDDGTGWSLAWKINFWARLYDGNRAYQLLQRLLRPSGDTGYNYLDGGGVYLNLFDAHPPFQIDGNFGATAGMAEMLLQSHGKSIVILPALPDAWKKGYVKGLRARGGFEVDISWQDKQLEEVQLTSMHGNPCLLRYGNAVVKIDTEKGKTYIFNSNLGL